MLDNRAGVIPKSTIRTQKCRQSVCCGDMLKEAQKCRRGEHNALRRIHFMANTFTSLRYHIVYSTKHRRNWIRPEIESRVWSYLGGIARENEMKALLIGGIDNHVHMLLAIPPKISVSAAVKLIKGGSSRWMNETISGLAGFGWQDGYGAFSLSKSGVPSIETYIRNQREHHRTITFEQEYRSMLDEHDIHCDERYIFDGEIVG